MGLLPSGEPGMVLRKASCNSCATITSAFERTVLRKLWQPIRAGLNLRSYRKKDVPRFYPVQIERNGIPEEVTLPLADFPAVTMFPTFKPPGCLTGECLENGIGVNGNFTIQVAGPLLTDVALKLGASKISVTCTFERHTYERLLCKVAYCYAVTQLGLDSIENNFIVPIILGNSPQVGQWLGCDGKVLLNPNNFHSFGISVQDGVIHCRVRLFARFGAPEYHVVVGVKATSLITASP